MSIAAGTLVYKIENHRAQGIGLTLTEIDLTVALESSVADLLFDEEGIASIRNLLNDVATTEFERNEIERILTRIRVVDEWRIGEAIGESYLVSNCGCFFPWPDNRDERKNGSSLPGADLVGFHHFNGSHRFAFGEVKTSYEEKYPPNVMYGRTGLKKQLEDLNENPDIRKDLIKYLAHRAVRTSWENQYRDAARRYLVNTHDISLFGILIRDVRPHQNDLITRVNHLGKPGSSIISINLYAIYIPLGSIQSLVEQMELIRIARQGVDRT